MYWYIYASWCSSAAAVVAAALLLAGLDGLFDFLLDDMLVSLYRS